MAFKDVFRVLFCAFLLLKIAQAEEGKESAEVDLLDHVVIIYSSYASDLEQTTFMDLAKLTNWPISDKIEIHQMAITETMGQYRLRIRGSKIKMDRLSNQNREKLEALEGLESFIKDTINTIPAKAYSLILQGHGYSHLFRHRDGQVSVKEIREVLNRVGVKLCYLSFDSCLMSTIETLYEMRDSAKFITAHEDYCPDMGIISPQYPVLLGISSNAETAIKAIAQEESRQHDGIETPADISVIKTENIVELVAFVKSLNLSKKDFKEGDAVDPKEKDYEYDLYNIVMDNPNISTADKEKFSELFSKCLIFYQANKAKKGLERPEHHGISILKSASSPSFSPEQKTLIKQLDYFQKPEE